MVQARARAVQTAQRQADALATAAGFARARLLSLSISQSLTGDRPLRIMEVQSRASATPIEPGEVSTSVTLTASYRLER